MIVCFIVFLSSGSVSKDEIATTVSTWNDPTAAKKEKLRECRRQAREGSECLPMQKRDGRRMSSFAFGLLARHCVGVSGFFPWNTTVHPSSSVRRNSTYAKMIGVEASISVLRAAGSSRTSRVTKIIVKFHIRSTLAKKRSK